MSTIHSKEVLYTAAAGATVEYFFIDVIKDMRAEARTEARAIFNGTMIEIYETDATADLLNRWSLERKQQQATKKASGS